MLYAIHCTQSIYTYMYVDVHMYMYTTYCLRGLFEGNPEAKRPMTLKSVPSPSLGGRARKPGSMKPSLLFVSKLRITWALYDEKGGYLNFDFERGSYYLGVTGGLWGVAICVPPYTQLPILRTQELR